MDRDVESGIIVIICGCLGLVFAYIVDVMNTKGYLINEFIIGTISITDLQILIVVIWMLVGIIIAALR